jgi:hypothetical protein
LETPVPISAGVISPLDWRFRCFCQALQQKQGRTSQRGHYQRLFLIIFNPSLTS